MAGGPHLDTRQSSGFSSMIFGMRKVGPEIIGWDFGGGLKQLTKAKFHSIL